MNDKWPLLAFLPKGLMLTLKEASIVNNIPIKELVQQFINDGLQSLRSSRT